MRKLNKVIQSQMYDVLYEVAGKIFKKLNPCDLVNDTCFESRRDNQRCRCCEGCKHFRDKEGCVVKALGCKLWLCMHSSDQHPYIKGYLDALRTVATNVGILSHFRASKEEEGYID